MFDSIGFQELFLIGLVALLVVGPKQLPVLMRKGGQFMGKMRGMAADFRATFDEMARQSELDELRKEVEALRNNNPLQEIKDEITKPWDTGTDPFAQIDPPLEPTPAQTLSPAPTPAAHASNLDALTTEIVPAEPIFAETTAQPAPSPAKPRKVRAKKSVLDTPA